MCGITGFIGEGNRDTIKKMADTLRHRGPDDDGFFVDESSRVHLGFRRLSIIDLTTGAQPMTNEDASVVVVFNGEIYNFQELRTDLEKRRVFKTQTDTEVIVHLYEEIGGRCFEKFNGMFAIALWDKKKKKLVLARDRMGKKPVYWAKFGNTFIFGSELKAILAHPAAKKELCREAVLKYFFFLSVPSPWTIYKDIYKLEPGQMLVYELPPSPHPARGGSWGGGSIHQSFYWQPRYETDPSITLADALSETNRLLADATRLRLVADVPLGIFLSGGIDSSLIAYYAAQASGKRIKTFSIGFDASTFDESPYAQAVSERIGSEHHVEMFEPHTLIDCIPEVAGFLDEPLADSAVLPTYLLSQFTRKHVTVALGGDGGDELYLGYPTLQAHTLAEWYQRWPKFLQDILAGIADRIPVTYEGLSFDYKLKTFLRGAPYALPTRHHVWNSTFRPEATSELFTPEFLPDGSSAASVRAALDSSGGGNSFDIITHAAFLYERYFLGDQVLTKVDRASMATSLEARAPFLDVRLVELAHRIPVSLRLRFWQNKYLLKKLARGKLPDKIIDRPKKGFWVPIGPWLRQELVLLQDQYLNKGLIDRQGIFNFAYIERLRREHMEGRHDHRKILWSLLMFQMWQERWN